MRLLRFKHVTTRTNFAEVAYNTLKRNQRNGKDNKFYA